jgi:hypothetical protein
VFRCKPLHILQTRFAPTGAHGLLGNQAYFPGARGARLRQCYNGPSRLDFLVNNAAFQSTYESLEEFTPE